MSVFAEDTFNMHTHSVMISLINLALSQIVIAGMGVWHLHNKSMPM